MSKSVLHLVTCALFLTIFGRDVHSAESWSEVYPRPSNATLREVGTDGTNWVAVGDGGTILVSPDGEHWSKAEVPSGNRRALHGVAFGAGRWVAVGDRGTILLSGDGATWTNSTFSAEEGFAAVAHGKDRFVAVGSYGLTAVSTNGVDWSLAFSPNPWAASLRGIAFGKDLFVAGGLTTIQTSDDGREWTPRAFEPHHDIHSVFFDGDQFLAGRIFGVVFASLDGMNWTPTSGMEASSINQFARRGERWFAAAGRFYESRDLAVWEERETGGFTRSSGGGIFAVEATPERIVVAGEAGNILSSKDGTNFVQHRVGRPLPIGVLANHGEQVIATAASGQVALSATAGHNWSETATGLPLFLARDAASDGKRVVLVGSGSFGTTLSSQIRTSGNGSNWVTLSPGHRGGLNGVAAIDGFYVAVGAGGVVYTSTNGMGWSSNSIPGDPTLLGVASDGARTVIVGPARTNYHSSAGQGWAATSSQATVGLSAVAWGGGRFVAVGTNGTVSVSSDGQTWRLVPAPTTANLRRVTYNDGRFLAVAAGVVMESRDGEQWTVLPATPPDVDRAIATRVGIVAASASTIYLFGNAPIRLSLSAAGEDMITVGIESKVLDVLQIESSRDLTVWRARESITNRFGFTSVSYPTQGATEFFRVSRRP